MCGLLKKVEEFVEEAKFGGGDENAAFDLLELDFVFDEAIGEEKCQKGNFKNSVLLAFF